MKTSVLLLFLLSVLVTVPMANADCSPGEVFIPVGDVLHCGPDPSSNGDYNCWWEQWGICLPPYYGLMGSAQRVPGSGGFARTAVLAADVAKVPAPHDPAAEVPGFSALGAGSSRAPWDVLRQLRSVPVVKSKNALHGASAPPDPWDDCPATAVRCGECGWNLFCYFYCC